MCLETCLCQSRTAAAKGAGAPLTASQGPCVLGAGKTGTGRHRQPRGRGGAPWPDAISDSLGTQASPFPRPLPQWSVTQVRLELVLIKARAIRQDQETTGSLHLLVAVLP